MTSNSSQTTSPDQTLKPKTQYLLDTNVLVSDPNAMFNFEEHDVVINMTVLEELDHLKERRNDDIVRKDTRIAIQNLRRIVDASKADPSGLRKGVPLPSVGERKITGNLRIINEADGSVKSAFKKDTEDNWIISTTLMLQNDESNIKTVLVTKDINMMIKARAAGVKHVEDYLNDHQIQDIDYLATGYEMVDLSETDMMNSLGENGGVEVVSMESNHDRATYYIKTLSTLPEWAKDCFLHKVFINTDEDCILRVSELSVETDHIRFEQIHRSKFMNRNVSGIKPRNIQQGLATDALLDENVSLVMLTGPAGSGKTLIAMAAALEQAGVGDLKQRYDRIIVTRSATDMDEGIGFLPGTEEEKMLPWLAAFTDSMEVIMKPEIDERDDEQTRQNHASDTSQSYMLEKANVQFKSLNFMRGRSFNRSLIIFDESQNATAHTMKSMLTRVGEGSKMIVMGNLSQIDAKYITPVTSGLTHAVEVMKNFEGAAVINLPGGERSALSAFAEDNM
jgi:PhoH-like ATPase